MGCHQTRTQAAAQIYAINQSEGNIDKNMHTLKEGDFVMGATTEGLVHGMIEHIMTEGGTLGTPGSEYALVSMPPENPAMSVRIYKEEDGEWEPTAYSIGMMYADAQKIDIEEHEMDAEETMKSYHKEDDVVKEYEGCGCPTCKELNVNCENCPVCQADMSKSYHSDDEEMDKWDNVQKACWVGYEQRGMKEKDGRMVPNCVPVKKAQMANAPYQDAELDREDSAEIEMAAKPNYEDMIKPRRSGSTPANPRLYAAVVQAAKDKFDVYPSAVANGWVVQEYKRRGGTYKGVDMDKREFSGGQRERMAEAGTAMPDGSFPIGNRADLMNAIRSVGRAKDYGAARAHIVRRARALNAMDMLPEDWRNKATKGMGQWSGSIFDLNPFVK
jgi:hypothetical protein